MTGVLVVATSGAWRQPVPDAFATPKGWCEPAAEHRLENVQCGVGLRRDLARAGSLAATKTRSR